MGRSYRGTLIATDESSARASLKRDGIAVVTLVRRRPAPDRPLRAAAVTLLTRQLCGLLRAGLPLLAALELIAGSHPNQALARTVGAIARDIGRGSRFSAALGRYPQSFGPLYCQVAALGESSGALVTVLEKLAAARERSALQHARLRAALTYPCGVLFVALLIAAGLLIWVVPTFQQIFASVGAPLPAPTRFVLALSDLAVLAAPGAGAGLLAAALALRAALQRFAPLRLAAARAMLRAPLLGKVLRQLCMARWSHALGTLVAAGTPLVEALEALGEATGNPAFDCATHDIAQRLRRGERLAAAMRASACFTPALIQPVAIAEEAGALDAMLIDLAGLNEREVDERIAALANLAEPLIIVVLGALVGGLVIAMYLPIIQLGNVV
jgi:type IV pilus assembly protein PilC